jgi:K319L-like, PKD domain
MAGVRRALIVLTATVCAVGCSGGSETPAPPGADASLGGAAGSGGQIAAGTGGTGQAGLAGSGGQIAAGAGGAGGQVAAGSGGAGGSIGVDASADGSACAQPDPPLAPDDSQGMPAVDPALAGQQHRFFKITVKDAASGTPIEGATLTTTNKIALVSDQNGVVAFYEPGLMGLDVYFSVTHPGYEYPADAFGGRGKALAVTEGGSAELTMQKTTGAAAPAQGDLASRLVAGNVPGPSECMAIRLVDPSNGRGVPLCDLSAFGEHYWSDSQGLIAYCNPDHVGESISFAFASYGYELASGGAAAQIATSKGGEATVELARTIIAERLYRIVGAGIYRDSVLLGRTTPLKNPTIVAQVTGQDTASTALYQGKIFWLWQDTDRASYWLGNFSGTAATSLLPTSGGLSPDRGVDLTYFTGADGFARGMCSGCDGGPAWMAGIVSVPDDAGTETLVGGYAIVNGDMSPKETGLVQFDDAAGVFNRVITDFLGRPYFVRPDGHAAKLGSGQQAYVYYWGRLRVAQTLKAFLAPDQYEQFTPYGAAGSADLQRAPDGTLDYAWRAGGRHVDGAALEAAGVAADQDLDGHDRAIGTGNGLDLTANSIAYNSYRGRFLRIAQQMGAFGDLWHAEADTPMGPWVYAQKIISHPGYTFYNPFYHPELDRGRFAYVEGTYTNTFTSAEPTPRYNYNQEMYRVDLGDPRLVMPVPVYDLGSSLPADFATKRGLKRGMPAMAAAFLAPDRPMEGTVPVAWSTASCAPGRRLVVGDSPPTEPVFYALPSDAPARADTVGLYELTDAGGHYRYGLATDALPTGFARSPTPIALVWQNPVRIKLPVADYLGDVAADAGADQCVSAGADVTLDGSASSSLAGAIVRYRWHLPAGGACEYVDGKTITVPLSKGVHSIGLETTDAAGNAGDDAVTVLVE